MMSYGFNFSDFLINHKLVTYCYIYYIIIATCRFLRHKTELNFKSFLAEVMKIRIGIKKTCEHIKDKIAWENNT